MSAANQTDRSIFNQSFSTQTQNELLDDDHFAWQSVCSVLIAIVCMGLLLGTFGVVLSLFYQ